MRKIFNLAMVAVLALGAASCTKEAGMEIPGEENTKKLAFSFEGMRDQVVPYSVAAENFEKAFADATVYIFEYKADKSGQLLLVQNEDFSSTNNYLMIVDDNTNALVGKELVAYFTLNNGTGFNAHANLTAYTAGSTKTEAEFAAVATDAVSAAVGRSGFLMAGAITGNDHFPNYGEYPIEVKRRVARFDIVNQNPTAISAVTKVTLVDAKNVTNVFGDATVAAAAQPIATDVVYDLTATKFGDTGAKLLAWEAGKDAVTNQDIATANSVFYANPTELYKDTPTDGTQIFIEATVGGQTKVFQASLSAAKIDIKANHRYILTLTSDLRFRITVADWETDATEIIDTKPLDTKLGFAAGSEPAGTAVNSYVGNTVALKPAATGTVTFTMTASSAQGTSFSWDAAPAGLSVVVDNKTAATYAAPYFKSEYKITVDSDLTESFFQTLTITDKANPSNKYEINFMYSNGNADVVTEINEATFPDATLRAYVENTLGLTGKITQAQLDAIKVVSLSHIPQVSSLTGIEYFTKITGLHFVNLANIESFDATPFSRLITLSVAGSNLKSLDVSNLSELDALYAPDTKHLTSINLSGTTSLKKMTVANNPVISSIDVSTCTSLELLHLMGCSNISDIDISSNLALKDLNVAETAISSLNTSKNIALETLNVYQMSNLATIDVSANLNLTYLNLALNPHMSNLNIENNPKLTVLGLENTNIDAERSVDFNINNLINNLNIGGTPTKNLDVSMLPNLLRLTISNTEISSLDISNNPLIVLFRAENCPNLTSPVLVWTGFDESNPQNHFTAEASTYPGITFKVK